MKIRTLSLVLLSAGLSGGVISMDAGGTEPVLSEVLNVEEQFADALLQAMLNLVATKVAYDGDCEGELDANLTVTNNGNDANGYVEDVEVAAEDVTEEYPDNWGTVIQVQQQPDGDDNLGEVSVEELMTYASYNFYSSIAWIESQMSLDDRVFENQMFKNYREVDAIDDRSPPFVPTPGSPTKRVLDYGDEHIHFMRYPLATWAQQSYLWRPGSPSGYILIEKSLVASDANEPCFMQYTAWVENYAGGFQTLQGVIALEGGDVEPVEPPQEPEPDGPSNLIVFLTSSTHKGNFGGITSADAICQDLADDAGLEGTFKAWLSDDSVSPASSFEKHSAPYIRPDGVQVADNWQDLTDGSLDAPIVIHENGSQASASQRVWTQTNAAGQPEGDNCNEWTTTFTKRYGATGQPTATDESWTMASRSRCYKRHNLYCVQQQ